MEKLIKNLNQNTVITIKGKDYIVKTKTEYSIEEDVNTTYIKCELSNSKVLVIIPDDELIYIGTVIDNMKYQKIASDKIMYNNVVFNKTGEGHQFIKSIEFGNKDEVEGKCIFEDYETTKNIISLGILTDNNNQRADVYAEILDIEDVKIK